MAELLPPAVQKFVADAEGFLGGLEACIKETEKFADRLDKASLDARKMGLAASEAAAQAAAAQKLAADAADRLRDSVAEAAAAQKLAAETAQKLEKGEIGAAEAQRIEAQAAQKVRDVALAEAAAQELAATAARKLERAQLAAAAAQVAAKKAASSGGADGGAMKQIQGLMANIGEGLGSLGGPAALIAIFGALPTVIGAVTIAVGGLGTALMALPGLIGIAAGALVTLKLAFSGVGNAIKAGWKGDMTAFKAALDDLSPSARTFAKAIVGMHQPLAGLKNLVQQNFFSQFSDQVAALGHQYIPLVKEGLGGIATSLGKVVNSLTQFLSKSETVSQVKGVFSGIGSVIEKFAPAVGKMADAVTRLMNSGLKNFFGPLAEGAAKLAGKFDDWVKSAQKSGLLKDLFANLLSYIKAIGDPLIKLGKAMVEAFGGKDAANGAKGLGEALNKIVDDIIPKLPTFVKAFSAAMRAIDDAEPAIDLVLLLAQALGKLQDIMMTDVWPAIGKGIKSIGSAAKSVGGFFSGPFLTPFKAIGSFFSGPFLTPFKAIGSFFSGPFLTPFKAVGHFFTSTLPSFFSNVGSFFASLPGKIISGLQSLPSRLAGMGRNAAEKLAYGLGFMVGLAVRIFTSLPGKVSAAWTSFWHWLSSKASQGYHAVIAVVTNGYHSVINWFGKLPGRARALWNSMWSAITHAVSTGYHGVMNWISRIPGQVASYWNRTMSRARSIVSNGINAVVNFFKQLPGRVASALSSVPSRVYNALSAAIGRARSVGGQVVSGFINGLRGGLSGIINEAQRLAEAAISGFKHALNINSPSRVFMDIAKNGIGGGLVKGLASAHGMVNAATNALVRAATPNVGSLLGSVRGSTGELAVLGGGAAQAQGGNVYVTVQGSVIAERDLQRTVQTQTLRYNLRNPTNGLTLTNNI